MKSLSERERDMKSQILRKEGKLRWKTYVSTERHMYIHIYEGKE